MAVRRPEFNANPNALHSPGIDSSLRVPVLSSVNGSAIPTSQGSSHDFFNEITS